MTHSRRPHDRGAAARRLETPTSHAATQQTHDKLTDELTDEQIALAASDEEVAYALFGTHVRQRLLELITLRGLER